jgi:type IV secretory pathway VirB10-like protein
MATAMAFPEAVNKGGRGKVNLHLEGEGFSKNHLSRARYVLRNNPIPEGQSYPHRCLDIMAGSLSLTEAYELTQADVKKREEEARIRAENAEKLNDVRARYPNLAALVDDERLSLAQAIASAEQSDREARELAEQEAREKAEKERREREAEEARMAEEERTKREAERQAKEDRENRLVGFFHQLNQLISGTSVVANDAQVQQLDQYKGEWDRFSQTYHHQRRDVIRSLTALRNNLPVLITKLEAM